MTPPTPHSTGAGSGPPIPDGDTLAEIIERVSRPDWDAFQVQIAGTGGCARPVRLKGTLQRADPGTGELETVYDTASQPDGVLLKACQARRATVCAACAAVYKADARQFILAGLVGGKGIPETVATRPLVFATLTAPSYGPVHTAHPHQRSGTDTVCRPTTIPCPCGEHHSCLQRHQAGDPILGMPLCLEGYDHPGAVIWNNRAGELWRRTTIATRRHLARNLGATTRTFNRTHRLAYLKIVEYQTRGLIHIHALLRLDPADGQDQNPMADSAALAAAVLQAATRITIAHPLPGRPAIRWGTENHIDPVPADGRARLAGYLAKYTTKSIDTNGALDHRLHRTDLAALDIDEHHRQLVHAAWNLHAHPALGDLGLRRWAHTLGYRGHWLTKSPNWSTTLNALRHARHQHRSQQSGHPTDDQYTIGHWTYQATGHNTDGDTWLANNHHHNRQTNRRAAWEDRP